MKKLSFLVSFLSVVTAAFSAHAESGYLGMAKPWEIDFQPPVTPVMDRLYALHNHLLLPIIFVVAIFVLLLLAYICLRFRHKHNPVPSKTAHNTRLEIIWTVLPILILVVIAIPSLRDHYYMEIDPNPGLTVKVTGHQWYWHYDYPDNGNFGFDSYILQGKDLKPGDIRQLSVDNPMVVPVGTNVRVLITGADVIHSWAVPSFGVKRDAVPGRLNSAWFKIDRIGTFFGQCSQLCGVGHGYMPIEVKAVSQEEFDAWVKGQQKAAGITPAAQTEEHPAKAPTVPAAPVPAAGTNKPTAMQPLSQPVQQKEKKRAQEKGSGKPVEKLNNLENPSPESKE